MTCRANRARVLLLLVLALAGGSCSGGEQAGRPAARNLLLITIDTLRADRLGTYGYAKPTSPALDELAASSIVFENAQAESSWTLPSLASLMTSVHSSTHACFSFRSRLDDSFTTLAEQLQTAGFATGGVASHVFLGAPYGLQQGFEDFDVELVTDFVSSHEAITSEQVTARALRWLEGRHDDGRPWLLWVHYFDPHATYQPHPGSSERFGRGDEALYDGEIAFTDRAIGALLTGLRERGLEEQTLIGVIADHGEEFGDHGGSGHGRTLHREVLRVPLIVRAPGFEAARVAQTVQTVDVLPTLLELLQVAPLEHAVGRSLVPLMRGDSLQELPALAELALNPNNPIDSILADGWKLVRQRKTGRTLLFDVISDPGEIEDRAADQPEMVAALRPRLDAAIAEGRQLGERFDAAAPLELSSEEIARLRALGYVDP